MAEGIVIREAHFPGRAPIEAYGNGGFRFADMSHRGSLLCLPSGIYGWEPKDPLALTPDDFARVFAEAGQDRDPAGRQRQGVAADPEAAARRRCATRRHFGRSDGDGAAVRTYNVLLAEDRAVAAALIAVD